MVVGFLEIRFDLGVGHSHAVHSDVGEKGQEIGFPFGEGGGGEFFHVVWSLEWCLYFYCLEDIFDYIYSTDDDEYSTLDIWATINLFFNLLNRWFFGLGEWGGAVWMDGKLICLIYICCKICRLCNKKIWKKENDINI